MGKIVSNFFISLDGVVEAPHNWHFPYFNDEMGAAVQQGVEASKAFLMGRVLYEEWSDYWQKSDEESFASFINNVPKCVVSNTLRDPSWKNTTVIGGEATQIKELKERIDGDITMSGSATTVRWLLQEGLLDELNLLLHPIAVGSGQRLFEDHRTYPLELTKSETFSTGVLNLTYVPARS